MKKISIMATLLMGLIAVTSCESDRDDNPVMQHPTSFTMNEPVYGSTTIDLLNTTSVVIKAGAQPNYGFPTEVTYGAQMSLSNNWVVDSVDYYTLDITNNTTTLSISGAEIDKGIMVLGDYSSESQLNTTDPMTVYIRMTAKPVNFDASNTIFTEPYALKVYPYYIELSDAEPVLWWLIGGPIGNGAWTNDGSTSMYMSVFPLTPEAEYEFDKKTGLGELQTTIFVPAGQGFKIIRDLGSWAEQWGERDGAPYSKKGGNDEGGDFKYEADGFYTITLNTKDDKLTIVPADISPATYSAVSIIGLNGDWENDIDMSPAVNAGANNHMWTAQLTVAETTQFKFRADHDWAVNWGYGAADGDVNLFGFGQGNGKNIGIEPGSYTIYLNDIDGYFRLIKHE
jgi:hypothetical protein